MTEAQQLKQHMRWLEDQTKWDGPIHERIEQIKADVAAVVHSQGTIANSLIKIVDSLETLAASMDENAKAVRGLASVIEKLIQAMMPQPQPTPSASAVLAELFGQARSKSPKRPRSKPELKVVRTDPPAGQSPGSEGA